MRGRPYFLSSTLTPHQMWCSMPNLRNRPRSNSLIRSDRFVSTWNVCQLASSITVATASMYSSETRSWKRSLIELTKIVLGDRQRSGSASFSGTSLRSKPFSKGWPGTPLNRSENVSA